MKRFNLILIAALSLSSAAVFANNQEPAFTAKEMENYAKYSTLGQEHAILKDLVGKWKVKSKMWMDAKSKPEESKGTQTNKLIMNGRFLQSEHKSTAMGKPYTGMGLLGFDLVKKEFQSTWVDSMNTSVMVSTGEYDAETKTLSDKGEGSCPMTGEKDKVFKGELKLIDKNHYTYAMYTKDKNGKEFKTLEINYTK